MHATRRRRPDLSQVCLSPVLCLLICQVGGKTNSAPPRGAAWKLHCFMLWRLSRVAYGIRADTSLDSLSIDAASRPKGWLLGHCLARTSVETLEIQFNQILKKLCLAVVVNYHFVDFNIYIGFTYAALCMIRSCTIQSLPNFFTQFEAPQMIVRSMLRTPKLQRIVPSLRNHSSKSLLWRHESSREYD